MAIIRKGRTGTNWLTDATRGRASNKKTLRPLFSRKRRRFPRKLIEGIFITPFLILGIIIPIKSHNGWTPDKEYWHYGLFKENQSMITEPGIPYRMTEPVQEKTDKIVKKSHIHPKALPLKENEQDIARKRAEKAMEKLRGDMIFDITDHPIIKAANKPPMLTPRP